MRSLVTAARNALVVSPIQYVSTNLSIPSRAPTSGATENMESYATIGTFHAIVNRLATGVAQVDWKLWRSAKSGKDEDRQEVTVHAALDLLENPTPFHSRAEMMEAVQQHNDITGLGYLVLGRAVKSGPPINMYYVRPDRMAPLPHASKYLEGYVYFGPDGEKVFLEVDEVLQLRCPDPRDPFGGIAPIQSVMTEAQSYRYAQQWNRNFFLNDASPGGIIQLDKRLSDPDFFKLRDRWRQSHQGVGNAHRVGILEQGKWVERSFNQRDMQFVEMAGLSSKAIREAYGFPKFALGDVEDVNRASAEASDVMLARWLINPRLERWRGMLNNRLLPLFGPTGVGLEFDYEDPVPPDQAAEDLSLEARTRVYVSLIGVGVDPADASSVTELPVMTVTPPALPAPSAPPPFDRSHNHGPRNADDLDPAEAARIAQLEQVQTDWQAALDTVMTQWAPVNSAIRDSIYTQIRAAVTAGSPAELAALTLPPEPVDDGTTILAAAMAGLAVAASQRAVDEAAAQGVNLDPVALSESEMTEWAGAVTVIIGSRLLVSASREAVRRATPTSTPDEVVQGVRTHLEGLSDRDHLDQLGGALTNAQNSARIETMRAGPQAEYYADETLDENTCGPCAAVDRKWLGETLAEVERLYPNGGYVDCLGRERCRGTVVAIWRPETTTGQ
jgi:HK97 family phage portal protein